MLHPSQFGQSGTIWVRMGSEIVPCLELCVNVSAPVAQTIRHFDFVLVPIPQFVSTRSWFARHQVTSVGEIAGPGPMARVAEREGGWAVPHSSMARGS